jgi:L-amino acid N-acyltransferase YncA
MTIRDAVAADLSSIVAIYNAAIPGRMATADTSPVTPESRQPWFDHHDPRRRPLWVAEEGRAIVGWLSFQSFYGRPAYWATAEVSVYVAPSHQGKGIGRTLLEKAVAGAPGLGLRTLLGFIFGHNAPSLGLFERLGFQRWGVLPGVAELDGVERDLVIVGKRIPLGGGRSSAGAATAPSETSPRKGGAGGAGARSGNPEARGERR